MNTKKRQEYLDSAACALHDARHAVEKAQKAFFIAPDERSQEISEALEALSEAWGPVNAAARKMRHAADSESEMP